MKINDKGQLDSGFLTKEDLELFSKIKKIKMSNSVLNFYKKNVKGNKNETKKTASKKLIRNIMLANNVQGNAKNVRIFYYGELAINVNLRTKKILWLNNNKKNKEYNNCFRLDKKKKKYLSTILNIKKGSENNGSCINQKR